MGTLGNKASYALQFLSQTHGQVNPNLHIYVKFHYQPIPSVLEHLESTDLGSQVLIGSILQEEFDHGEMVLLSRHIQWGKAFLQTGNRSAKVMWHLYRTLFYPLSVPLPEHSTVYCIQIMLPTRTVYRVLTVSTCIGEMDSSLGPSWSKQTI